MWTLLPKIKSLSFRFSTKENIFSGAVNMHEFRVWLLLLALPNAWRELFAHNWLLIWII